jgi:hypothetical protein
MRIGLWLIVCLAIASPCAAQQVIPTLSKQFTLSAEEAYDAADQIDESAGERAFETQMDSARDLKNKLGREAETDAERKVVASVGDMLFASYTCHAIAVHGGPEYPGCMDSVHQTRRDFMVLLGRHKSAGSWIEGPPV